MRQQYYLELAQAGLRMPIGADLVLNEQSGPEEARLHPERLADVLRATARRYRTPLAFPLMDLTIEKEDLLAGYGVRCQEAGAFHFHEPPPPLPVDGRPFPARLQAHLGALRLLAREGELLPVGMLIGPFSLMTKLVADPIAPVALAGRGLTGDDDASIGLIEACLERALETVLRSARAQMDAGARAMVVCEPAANTVYLSPRQLRAGSDVFERFVLAPNRTLRDLLAQHGVDLFFHNCGELTAGMVAAFARELRPSILSLGSSRRLWEDAQHVDKDIVLYGNLPTKTFYSDAAMPREEVRRIAAHLVGHMRACGHPHILGSECDVLDVPGAGEVIRSKMTIFEAQ